MKALASLLCASLLVSSQASAATFAGRAYRSASGGRFQRPTALKGPGQRSLGLPKGVLLPVSMLGVQSALKRQDHLRAEGLAPRLQTAVGRVDDAVRQDSPLVGSSALKQVFDNGEIRPSAPAVSAAGSDNGWNGNGVPPRGGRRPIQLNAPSPPGAPSGPKGPRGKRVLEWAQRNPLAAVMVVLLVLPFIGAAINGNLAAHSISWLPKVLMLLPMIPAFILHEFAHGWVASKFGDPTAKLQGRLTLNPRKHIDLATSILAPLAVGMGAAVPIPVQYDRMSKTGAFSVAVAGVVANIGLALVSSLALAGVVMAGLVGVDPALFMISPLDFIASAGPGDWLALGLTASSTVNMSLAVFNMIPIIPLDGGRVVSMILPKDMAYRMNSSKMLNQWGFVLALLAMQMMPGLIMPIGKLVLYASLAVAAGLLLRGGYRRIVRRK